MIGARRNVGPFDPRGIVLAGLAAAALFTLTVWGETQRIAALDGYQIQDLGPSIAGRLYAPFASLSWMMRVDTIIDTSGIFRVGIQIIGNPHEPAWARAAFAAERIRILWEFGIAFICFIVGAIAWTRPSTTSGLHGVAQWACDLRQSTLVGKNTGIVLGEVGSTLLVHSGTENVLAIGPPGVGKSDGIAVPTLLRTWPWSAVVFDPAGELRTRTASTRSHGTNILVFDPRDPASARYNPIAGIASTNIDAIQTVLSSYMLDRDLSEMSETSRYFIASAIELGTALVARSIELGSDTLAGAAEIYYGGPWKDDNEFCKSLLLSEVTYVKETGSKYVRMHNETRSSVIGTLTQFLTMFRSGDVARVTSRSDFDATMLRTTPTTLYLIVSERDQAALNSLLRMVLTRLVDDLTIEKPADNEQPILFLIDEFPLLKAPVIAKKLATGRKFRLSLVLLAQAVTQIRDYYGQNESVTGMCDVRVFFPTFDSATQELASGTCGDATHWSESINVDGNKRTRSIQEIGRPLLVPSDLAMLGNRIVVAKKGEMPLLAKPIRAHRDKRFRPIPAAPPKPIVPPQPAFPPVGPSQAILPTPAFAMRSPMALPSAASED
jgi:type IV secretion system protein VirD4